MPCWRCGVQRANGTILSSGQCRAPQLQRRGGSAHGRGMRARMPCWRCRVQRANGTILSSGQCRAPQLQRRGGQAYGRGGGRRLDRDWRPREGGGAGRPVAPVAGERQSLKRLRRGPGGRGSPGGGSRSGTGKLERPGRSECDTLRERDARESRGRPAMERISGDGEGGVREFALEGRDSDSQGLPRPGGVSPTPTTRSSITHVNAP